MPPPADIYKINSDGSFDFDLSNRSGVWGFVVRDNCGEVLAAGAGNITYAASSLQDEAIAAYKSISFMQHALYDPDNLGDGCYSSCFCSRIKMH